MLKNILSSISKTGYISKSRLAGELNVSKELIDDGIRRLMDMGYLIEEQTGENCSTSCGGCPFAKSCNKEIVKTFRLSDTATAYLNRDEVCFAYSSHCKNDEEK